MHQLPVSKKSQRTGLRENSRAIPTKMASKRTVAIKIRSKIMVELTSSTALPNREAASFHK